MWPGREWMARSRPWGSRWPGLRLQPCPWPASGAGLCLALGRAQQAKDVARPVSEVSESEPEPEPSRVG